MSRPHLVALCAFTCSLMSCTASGPADDLSGEAGDGDEKGDSTGVAYFQITPDPQQADLGGFLVSRPNKASTRCEADRAPAPSCFVRSIDASETGLAERIRGGEQIILRGRLALESAEHRSARVLSTTNTQLQGPSLAAVIAPAQPMINIGAEAGPDCLFAQLDITAMTVTTASLSTTGSSTDAVAFQGRLDGVSITGTSNFAVSCVSGTSPIAIHIDRVDISGHLSTAADGTLGEVVDSATLSGVTVQETVPGTVSQMLDLRDTGSTSIMAKTATLVLASVTSASPRAELELAATEVWTPGTLASDEDDDVENVFVLAKNAGDHIREERLNSIRSASIDVIDFDVANATDESRATARAALSDSGVIVAGTRFHDGDQTGRTAQRFWTRAAE